MKLVVTFILFLLTVGCTYERTDQQTVAIKKPQTATVSFSDNCSSVVQSDVAVGDIFAATGTTVGKTDDFSSWYPPTQQGARDVVTALNLTTSGVLRLDVTSLTGGYKPALYVQNTCGSDNMVFGVPVAHQTAFFEMPAGVWYTVVDGLNGTNGKFVYSVSFDSPICGDGLVTSGEQCDTGPLTGLGCTSCVTDAPLSIADTCPGESIMLPVGNTVVSGTTLGYTDDYNGSCSYAIGGVERVYAVIPSQPGILTAKINNNECFSDVTDPYCWDYVLYVRSSCNGSELSCADQDAFTSEMLSVSVAGGNTYYVFVDGYDDQYYSRGPFNLSLTLQ